MTYSVDFRDHVLFVRSRDCLTFQEASERFSVGIASLVRWSRELAPKGYVRKRGLKIDLAALAQDLCDHPDAYQDERAARFGVTQGAIWKALRRLDITHKKSLSPSEGK